MLVTHMRRCPNIKLASLQHYMFAKSVEMIWGLFIITQHLFLAVGTDSSDS